MNLRGVDLNLLVVLDALLRERSVSRAGEIVGLSPIRRPALRLVDFEKYFTTRYS